MTDKFLQYPYPENLLKTVYRSHDQEEPSTDLRYDHWEAVLMYNIYCLTEQERTFVSLRYERRMNYTEIAHDLRLSSQRIFQIDHAVIRKLYHRLAINRELVAGLFYKFYESERKAVERAQYASYLLGYEAGLLNRDNEMLSEIEGIDDLSRRVDLRSELSARSYNLLDRKMKIETLSQLSLITKADFLRLEGSGAKSAKEIEDLLIKYKCTDNWFK